MNPRFIRYIQILLIVIDVLVINAASVGIYILAASRTGSQWRLPGQLLGLYCTMAWLTIAFMLGIYKGRHLASIVLYFRQSAKGLVYLTICVSAYIVLFRVTSSFTSFTALSLLCFPTALLITRMVHLLVYHFLIKNEIIFDNVMVIGYNNRSRQLITLLEEKSLNKKIIGICEETENVQELYHYPILSDIDNAVEVCRQYEVTEIYSSIAPEKNHLLYKLIHFADAHCIHFHIIPDISVFINRKCQINQLNGLPLISLRNDPLEELSNRIKKKLFDLLISFFVVIVILSWMIPLVGLLVKLDSKGPVFFTQMRSGKGNKRFKCLKFRSMRTNALANELQATKNDDRLTRVGRFLRSTNLDEFPQFINVLKGDMSIVGPRPHMLKHTIKYSKMINQYMVRHFLKPGITGWAQVYGYRGSIDSFEKLEGRVERDLWYMENWCVWLDIKIIFMTIFATLKGDENAY